MMFKNLKRIFLLSVMIILHSSNSYACMFSYFPSNLMDDHDLLFTAKVKSCRTINNQVYVDLSVKKLWKGEGKHIYTAQIDSCGKFLSIGSNIMLVADYTENDDFIKIPNLGLCSHPTKSIDYNALSMAQNYWFLAEHGFLFIALTTPEDPNYNLGEPLYDYRTFGSFGSTAYYYMNVIILIGSLILILLSPLYVFRIAKRNEKQGKRTKGIIQMWAFFVIMPAIFVLTILFGEFRMYVLTAAVLFAILIFILHIKSLKKPKTNQEETRN
ncbi:MAG: hypothetical protein COB36_07570 [Alphaproteobacteria bacterium]|nr:MAG: hypothetical protein COB36_07570 [Alphaproteobacteria bacterium]